jgi:hypothetical protein
VALSLPYGGGGHTYIYRLQEEEQMAISQSKTEFIKGKGVVYNSGPKKGQKVTDKIKIVTDTVSGKKAGETYKYTKGKAKTATLVGKKSSTNKPSTSGASTTKTPPKPPITPPKGGNKYEARVASQRAAANKAGASTYSPNRAPAARSGATGTPLVSGSDLKRGITTKTGKVVTTGLPRGTMKPKTFGTKHRVGEKRSFLGVVKQWDGRKWVPLKKK